MMKRMLPWLGLWVVLASRGAAQDAAAVVSVEGKVLAMLAGTLREVKAEERLAVGSLVTTERNAKVVLALTNGASVQLAAEGELFLEETVDAAGGERRARLQLGRGEVVGNVPARTAGGIAFEVATPVGVVAPADAGGGMFQLRVTPAAPGALRVVLTAAKGGWVLKAAGGQSKTVAAGQELAFDVRVKE